MIKIYQIIPGRRICNISDFYHYGVEFIAFIIFGEPLKVTIFLASIVISSPVCGFLPLLSLFDLTGPFAESGDLDRVTFLQLHFEEVKKAFHYVDAIPSGKY